MVEQGGSSTISLMSVMQMANSRVLAAGSKTGWSASACCQAAMAARTSCTAFCARGVGSMPFEVRANRRSPKCARSLPRPMLTVDCGKPRFSAARVTLRLL